MLQRMILFLFLFLFCLSVQAGFHAAQFPQTADGNLLAWVVFKDKGGQNTALYKPGELLRQRAIDRRLLRRPNRPLVDYSDLPVYPPYLDEVRSRVQKIRVVSRWLNAVSVEATAQSLEDLQALDFVLKVDPVRQAKPIDKEKIEVRPETLAPKIQAEIDTLFYGYSFNQLDLIGVPFLHEKGLHGEGVVIGMLDDGVNLLNYHVAFDSLNVLATRDFIHGDDDVTDSEFKAFEGWHGTMTLSTIAGYVPTRLIGPAYRAQFLLAKTEVDQSETPVEEDYWVAGIEWLEQNGADIVSSSLGYIDWYSPADMDGETAKTTIAADLAVEKGVIVFNSAGNEGDNPDVNTLIAPADGKKVLAIAAVDRFGLRASFSSVGPTADGRIKPDLAAMGLYVYVASKSHADQFVYASGTSFSCPLAAGGAALLLQAYPQTTPELMARALKETASQAAFPDKFLGWGVINLEKAYYFLDTTSVVYPPMQGEHLAVYPARPNPASEIVKIPFQVTYPSFVEVRLFDIRGRKVLSFGTKFRGANRIHYETLQGDDLKKLASGVYVYLVLSRELGTGAIFRKSGKLVVLH
ncbi:S8 family serine peptidase [Caldithrix abyssi]